MHYKLKIFTTLERSLQITKKYGGEGFNKSIETIEFRAGAAVAAAILVAPLLVAMISSNQQPDGHFR